MRNIIWIAHVSLDGYVANKEGKLDDFESGEDNLDFVAEICLDADAILSGRITHELLYSFWPQAGGLPGATRAEKKYSNWYNAATKIVATKDPAPPEQPGVIKINNDLSQFVRTTKNKTGKAITIFGSPNLAGQLMEQNLIDVYWIFVNPVIFGEGVPLFKNRKHQRKLHLAESRRFANGETALKYIAVK